VSTARYGGITFAWDDAKAASNVRKHGLSFHEAITVFLDPLAIILEDSTAAGEQRQVIIGRSLRLRTVLAVFVERGETVRIVTAREATKHEKRRYEEGV
jgi:uncharacterized protein